MPSPLAHTAIGYLIYKIYQSRMPKQNPKQVVFLPRPLLATMGLSMLPDIDSVLGILLGDLEKFHNNVTHSLFFGLIVALSIDTIVGLRQRIAAGHWFIIALLCYALHVIMDFFTVGRGVMVLWPFSSKRYEAPVKLFYGLHWSDGIISGQHLRTLANELGVMTIVGLVIVFLLKATASNSK